jgi:hypothetical protein
MKKIDNRMYFCFMFFVLPNMIWSDYVSDHYKSYNCAYMYSIMHFWLSFTSNFYSCY